MKRTLRITGAVGNVGTTLDRARCACRKCQPVERSAGLDGAAAPPPPDFLDALKNRPVKPTSTSRKQADQAAADERFKSQMTVKEVK
jgi:hypothetical protein